MPNGKCETVSLRTAPLMMEKATLLLFSLFFLLLQLQSIATAPNVQQTQTTSIFVQMNFNAILSSDIPPQGLVDSLWITNSGDERWHLISEPDCLEPGIIKTYNFTHTSPLPLLETKEVYLTFIQLNPEEEGWIEVSHFVVKDAQPEGGSNATTILFCASERKNDDAAPVFFGGATRFAPCKDDDDDDGGDDEDRVL